MLGCEFVWPYPIGSAPYPIFMNASGIPASTDVIAVHSAPADRAGAAVARLAFGMNVAMILGPILHVALTAATRGRFYRTRTQPQVRAAS